MGRLFWDILDRTMNGPVMPEDQFENELFPTRIAEIVAKHRIQWNPDDPIMSDPDMADAVFRAGIELLLDVGLYCKDTRRIVKFTDEEVFEVIRSRKREVVLGSGREAVTLKPRTAGDPQHPYTFFCGGWTTRNVAAYKQCALTQALEPTCDGLFPQPMYGIGDIKPAAGTPSEILLVQTQAQIMREVADWVGRPGLFLGIPMSATTPIALMTVFSSGLLNKNNCCMPVQIVQDMRINNDRLNQAYFAQLNGITPWISSCPVLYAYLSGPEQAAVEMVAHTLGMMAISDGSFAMGMCTTIGAEHSGKDIWWGESAAALAVERNLKTPWITYGGTGEKAGSMTDVAWYTTAAKCIEACISGMEGMWLVGGQTGLECRWAGEVTRAAAGISVADGTRMLNQIAEKLKEPFEPNFVSIRDLYDNLHPKPHFVEHYRKFTRIFKDMGLDYPTWK